MSRAANELDEILQKAMCAFCEADPKRKTKPADSTGVDWDLIVTPGHLDEHIPAFPDPGQRDAGRPPGAPFRLAAKLLGHPRIAAVSRRCGAGGAGAGLALPVSAPV